MKVNTTKIHISKIPKQWKNFQKNRMPSPRCDGCKNKCTVLYDLHHDEYFSLNCGKVIIEQGHHILPYNINYTYNHTIHKKKKRRKRHRKI